MLIDTINFLIREQGSPFYFFDADGFIENYKELDQTFKSVYPYYQISYSYKTNYTPYICELVKKLGGFAEVVSDMEYMLAKKIGYNNPQIIYNGPAKGPLLEEHLLKGGFVNVDNCEEMRRICKIAGENPDIPIKLGLRINMDVGGDFVSRFGFEPGKADIEQAIYQAEMQKNIQLVGLHCHISRARGIEAWKRRTEIMLESVKRYFQHTPEYISLGSGMFGKMSPELSQQFGLAIPTYKEYAEAVLRPISDYFSDSEFKPMILTEPGTTLVSNYIYFITKILHIKEIRGRMMATTDGSFENLGEICTLKKLPVRRIPANQTPQFYSSLDIMGYTCLEQDLMYEGLEGDMAPGDYLIFENVGGYSIVSKPQFINPNGAMYAVRGNQKPFPIMRSETFEDVFSKFIFDTE